jgi:hypothetical protein
VYIETNTIVIPNGGQLVGENGAIINFNSGSYRVEVDGNSGTVETGGTVSVVSDATAVTGSGTTFTNLSSGDYILLGSSYHEIDTITDATNLTLKFAWHGNDISGQAMRGQSMYRNVRLVNVRIINSAIQGLFIRGILGLKMDNMNVFNCTGNSIQINDCYGANIEQSIVKNSGASGILIDDSFECTLDGYCHADNNDTNGIELGGVSEDIKVSACSFTSNGNIGIVVSESAKNIVVQGCVSELNDYRGIEIGASATNISLVSSVFSENTNHGIYLVGTNVVISGCIIDGNGGHGILQPRSAVIVGNTITNNGSSGIRLGTNDHENTIIGNRIDNNSQLGISCASDNNNFSGNTIVDNGNTGLHIESTSDRNIVGPTFFDNNGGGGSLVDQGTNSEIHSATIDNIGDPTYDHIKNAFQLQASAGASGTSYITDAGSGNIDVAAGAGFVRSTDSPSGLLLAFDWTASTGQAIPSNTIRYVGVEYNAGSPQVSIRTVDDWDDHTDFRLGSVVNEGGTLHILNNPQRVANGIGAVTHRLYETEPLQRAERVGGLILGETGTRNITVSAGELYDALNEFDITAKDTSASDTFDRYYRDGGGGWTKQTAQTQWDNTQYDDGDGTLGTMSSNWWKSEWYYLEADDALVALYGQNQYANQAQAEAEGAPSTVPDRLLIHGRLIGRLIVQQNGSSATEIQSAFTTTLSGAGVVSHTELSNIGTNTHAQIDTHIADTANPHGTDVENLGSGTLAELNTIITDATLDTNTASRNPTSHNTSHQSGGVDVIKLDDLATPDDNTDLDSTTTEHGLLPKLGGGTVNYLRADGTWNAPPGGGAHAGDHITGQSDEIDGDKLDIDWNPTNYTPSTTPTEADNVDNLTAHLYGVDQEIGTAATHIAATNNPHATDIENLGSGTLAELNSAVTDATLDDSSASRTPTSHASSHQNGGGDEISVAGLSGELADAQPVAVSKNSGAIVGTRSELNFIEGANITLTIADDAGSDEVDITIAASGGGGAHASDHITGGADEIDGDKLDIDWNPTNYTPSTTPTEADNVDNLTAHLYGIDQILGNSTTHIAATNNPHATDIENLGSGTLAELNSAVTDATLDDSSSSRTPTAHAGTHITGQSDEIDGDKLDIDWTPTNYTPSTTPSEADNLDNLTAHLYGIDQILGNSTTHIADTTNPHATDIENLGSGTLAELNGNITDATLDDSSSTRTPTSHASSHQNGGGDEVSVAGLSGELADAQPVAVSKNSGAIVGTRSELNFIEGTNVTLTNVSGGGDEIDGDVLDIDWNPATYTPATTPTEVTSVDELTAHLYGIDQYLATSVTATSTFGTDNVILRADGTGRGSQSTGITINDSNVITGPSGGMTIQGGTASGNDLTLESTSNATKGSIILATGTDFDASEEDIFNIETATFGSSPHAFSTTGAITIDLNQRQLGAIAVTGNITSIAFTAPRGIGIFTLIFTQHASTGPYTLPAAASWTISGGSVRFKDDQAPLAPTTASEVLILTFIYNGTDVFVSGDGDYAA